MISKMYDTHDTIFINKLLEKNEEIKDKYVIIQL